MIILLLAILTLHLLGHAGRPSAPSRLGPVTLARLCSPSSPLLAAGRHCELRLWTWLAPEPTPPSSMNCFAHDSSYHAFSYLNSIIVDRLPFWSIGLIEAALDCLCSPRALRGCPGRSSRVQVWPRLLPSTCLSCLGAWLVTSIGSTGYLAAIIVEPVVEAALESCFGPAAGSLSSLFAL